jgi:glycosyltransferase involved in cell wall biosynthesis
LVSVIIPVHNAGIFLDDCLGSVLAQSLKEIEVICVDDCSTDGSLDRLRSYSRSDARVTVIENRENKGPSAARNQGIESASGKYLLFVDADDRIDQGLCRKASGCAERKEADLVVFDYYTAPGNACRGLKAERESSLAVLDSSDKKALLDLAAFSWTKLVRSSSIRALCIRFPETISYSEDTLVHWQLVLQMDRIAFLPERLYFYRQQPNSICQRRERLADRITVYDRIREFLLSKSLYLDYCDTFLKQQLGMFCSVYENIDGPLRGDTMEMIVQRMTDEHWRFVADGELQGHVRDFYLSLQGKAIAKLRRSAWLMARWCYRLSRPRMGS